MGIKKNIEGQRFGNMVVLRDSGERNNAKVIWECQCDCGKIFKIRSDKIYNGSCKSCPKCANEKKLIDLTGQRFGKLTVLERDYNVKNNRGTACWKCLCDCGNITTVDGAHLRDGTAQSCGCLKQEYYKQHLIDITGQRFGLLTVLQKSERKTSNNSYYWICQCDCGTIKEVHGPSLRNHKIISCGCSKKSAGELKIEQILKENNIQFETQKIFNTCKFPNTNMLARYDFYLPDYNLLIEYDGEQHFYYRKNTTSWNTKENFEQVQYRDAYKNKWAEENNIKLKRIPYYDYDKITLEYLLS